MKKRLIIVQNFFSKQRLYLFNQLAQKVNLLVVYLQPPKSEHRKWTPEEESIRYKYIQLNFNKKLPTGIVWGNFKQLKKLTAFIKPNDAVVLLLNHPTNLIMLKLLRLLKQIKSIDLFLWVEDTIYGNWVDSLTHKYVKSVLDAVIIRQSNKFLLFSKASKRYVETYTKPVKKFTIVPQANLPRRLLPTKPHPVSKTKPVPTFGFLGYFVFQKNLYFLLNSFCNSSIPGKLIIAGGGPEQHHVTYFTRECPRKIKYSGYLKDTPENKRKFFQQLDYLILPSAKEVWGLVVNEAMYFGVPAIVSENVGASELVEQVDQNLIFNIKNTRNYIKIHGTIDSQEIYKSLSPKTQKDFYRTLKYAYNLWKNNHIAYRDLSQKAYDIATQKYTVDNAIHSILKIM